MNSEEFRAAAHQLVDWMSDYLRDIEKYPVRSQVEPGAIYHQIPPSVPSDAQPFEEIFRDFKELILPGMTHWQHPHFHAYFNGNSSHPSLLAEMLTATLAAQCMLWETSPAAAELEQRMMEWLRELLGLPGIWQGVIQDTASTATLVSLLSAREKGSQWKINRLGFQGEEHFRVYCSEQAHSSVEKAVRLAGLGADNLVRIEVDRNYAMRPELLLKRIEQDRGAGKHPLCVVATLGSTGSTAIDPLPEIGALCRDWSIWLHVDAAWAGTALMLPELKWLGNGLECADSFVVNPHKWMFTNFDCSAYFVRDVPGLLRTFQLVPEYLKTAQKGVNNYSDWGIQLGRRFRALKLWFVIRSFGKKGLQTKVRNHIRWAAELAEKVQAHQDFELMAPAPLATVCFRFHPQGMDPGALDNINRRLLEKINDSGKLYLTHTRLSGLYTIRLVVGQTSQQKHHIEEAWQFIQEVSATLA